MRQEIEQKILRADITRILRQFAQTGNLHEAQSKLVAIVEEAEIRGREEATPLRDRA